MPELPAALQQLIAELGKLPGVGRRSAERMAFALLASEPDDVRPLADAVTRLHVEVGLCETCGYYTDRGVCPICTDPSRDETVLCVVEMPVDVIAFERTGGFRARYHVLGGVLSPLKGISPDDLNVAGLRKRLQNASIAEVILATSPSVEGEATAHYLSQILARDGVRFTRIGRGVPMGGSLDLADSGTLRLALEGRRAID
ncbi:MAG: recombination protein RecR [Candidatus Sumerlaeota bacterium]|nr:recombination protein RecR [Candidatus Sumerlaeota bacterium]